MKPTMLRKSFSIKFAELIDEKVFMPCMSKDNRIITGTIAGIMAYLLLHKWKYLKSNIYQAYSKDNQTHLHPF